MSVSRRKPSPTMVVALVALLVALGGTGYALSIPRNSVGTRQLRNGSVTLTKLARSLQHGIQAVHPFGNVTLSTGESRKLLTAGPFTLRAVCSKDSDDNINAQIEVASAVNDAALNTGQQDDDDFDKFDSKVAAVATAAPDERNTGTLDEIRALAPNGFALSGELSAMAGVLADTDKRPDCAFGGFVVGSQA